MLAVALAVLALAAEPTGEPVTFEFVRASGPAAGRKQAYDAEQRQYLLHVHDIARFRVQAVAADLETRPVVLVISGMLDRPEGPLTLRVDRAEYSLAPGAFNPELFRVRRDKGVTTVEFLPAGKKLLRPGAEFQYIDFYR